MKKMLLLFCLLLAVAVSGCATDETGAGPYRAGSSGHQGHNH